MKSGNIKKISGFSSLLLLTAILMGGVNCGFGWGWCQNEDLAREVHNLEGDRFAGDWYELKREFWHDWGSDQLCTVTSFELIQQNLLFANYEYQVRQNYKAKFFGWDATVWFMPLFLQNGMRTLWQNIFEFKNYQIVGTDYDNYAVIYGCEDKFLWIFHYKYATLLSRRTFLEEEYVEQAKQKLLREYRYPFFLEWVDPGATCDFQAAPTKDELALDLYFGSVPDWMLYNNQSLFTSQAKELFEENEDGVPYGTISRDLVIQGAGIQTPFTNLVKWSTYQDMVHIKNIQLDAYDYDTFVDLWILYGNLTTEQEEQISLAKEILDYGMETSVCCYDFQEGSQFHLKDAVTGWARIIIHNAQGIIEIREGQFYQGNQYGFGRFSIQEESPASEEYAHQVAFMGWLPSKTSSGMGYANINTVVAIKEGEFISYQTNSEVYQGGWNVDFDGVFGSDLDEIRAVDQSVIVNLL